MLVEQRCKRCESLTTELVEESGLCIECFNKRLDLELARRDKKAEKAKTKTARSRKRSKAMLDYIDKAIWEERRFKGKKKALKLLDILIRNNIDFEFIDGDNFTITSGSIFVNLRSLKEIKKSGARLVRIKFHNSPTWYPFQLHKAMRFMANK